MNKMHISESRKFLLVIFSLQKKEKCVRVKLALQKMCEVCPWLCVPLMWPWGAQDEVMLVVNWLRVSQIIFSGHPECSGPGVQ